MAKDIEAELQELQQKSKPKSGGFGKIIILLIIAAAAFAVYWYYFR